MLLQTHIPCPTWVLVSLEGRGSVTFHAGERMPMVGAAQEGLGPPEQEWEALAALGVSVQVGRRLCPQ